MAFSTIHVCDGSEPLKALHVAGAPSFGADVSIRPGPTGAGGTPHLGGLVAWDGTSAEPTFVEWWKKTPAR